MIFRVRRVTLIKDRQSYILIGCLTAVLTVGFLITKEESDEALVVNKTEITINKRGERVYQGSPFTGEMVSYFDSGQQATADEFLKGRRQGHAKKWFKSGLLGYESNYLAGRREGYTRSWWFNGNPRSEFFYVNGRPEGVAWRWYRSGAKFKKFNYQAGQPAGLQQAWRENGKLSSNFEYRNGRTYGLKKANSCVGLEDEAISVGYYQAQANLITQ